MKNIVKTNNIAARVIEGSAFIINANNSTLHELDETGTFIWKLIEKKKDRKDIISSLVSEYEVTGCQAGADLDEFLYELEKKGIIEIL